MLKNTNWVNLMHKYLVKKGRYFDRDIEKIEVFLSANDCPENVIQKHFEKIYESMVILRDNPQIGTCLSTKTSIPNDYRYLISGQYLIFYKVFDSEKTVRVYRVFHSKENYLAKLDLSLAP